MTAPSVTYTFTNGTVADADQVNTNFTNIINALTDGSKSFSIDALTCAGTVTLNGAVNLGNATGDDITVTGYLASSLISKTTNTCALGSSSLLYSHVYSTLFRSGDGTVSAPAYAFNSSGNDDCGMWLSAANKVNFSAGGVEVLEMGTTGTEVVFNDGGADIDFRIEGSGAANAFFVQGSDGKVGIGTDGPGATLEIKGVGATSSTSSLAIRNSSNTVNFLVYDNGQIYFGQGGWGTGGTAVGISSNLLTTSPSSRRYKTNIQPLSAEIDSSKIYELEPVTFNYIADGRHSFGYIAEDVIKCVPSVVNCEPKGDNGEIVPESVAYDHLTVLIIEEMKNQKFIIEELRDRIERLEAR